MSAKLIALFILASATIAAARSCPSDTPERLPNGSWGGQHVGLVATDTGATIEYDCAAGNISGPLRLGANGEFDWSGTHYPGHGGPIRIDEPSNAHPARYTGRADAESMEMTLTLIDGTQPPQTFTLKRGGNAAVFKCL